MKKAIIFIACLLAANYLLSADQNNKNGFVQKFSNGKKTITIYAAFHDVPSRASILPGPDHLQKSKMLRAKPQDVTINSRPQVLEINPYYGWWGDNFSIYGGGFSKIYASNAVYFDSNAVTASLTSPPTGDELYFEIPAGTRSNYPNVASSGIGGENYLSHPLSMIAPLENIWLPGLVSIVEGTNKIYVGYQNNGDPTIAAINLYVQNPPGPQIYAIIDHGESVDPFLTRMAIHNGDNEYCYVKKVNEGTIEDPIYKKDVYCFDEISLQPLHKAHLHESCQYCFDPDIAQFTIKGIASSDFGNVFFVAYYLNGQNYQGHVLRVPRDNMPSTQSINPIYGNLYLSFPYSRAGIIADTTDGVNGNPGVFVASNLYDGGPYAKIYHIWDTGSNYHDVYGLIMDMETDRRISSPYDPQATGVYKYLMLNGIATLSDDAEHDVRGWVDGFDYDGDQIPDSLRISVNDISQIKLSTTPNKPVNNQFEILISQVPDLQIPTGFPNLEQVDFRLAKITIKGWKNRLYYLRILDPRDFSGYAPVDNPSPNPQANIFCRARSANGPYLNACDNQVWSDINARQDFGFCADIGPCTPVRYISILMQPPQDPNDPIGTTILYLRMPAQYAGDNVMIQLSETDFCYQNNQWPVNPYCADVSCPAGLNAYQCKMPVDSYSGVYTSWKRELIEREMMFKHGGFLYKPFDPDTCYIPPYPGCNKIYVFPITPPPDPHKR